jgi:hypothetical protein
MDENGNPTLDAWAMSTLGHAIEVYVDRTVNGPQVIQGSGQYGVAPDGSLYQLGKVNANPIMTVGGGVAGGSPLTLLILAAVVLMMVKH